MPQYDRVPFLDEVATLPTLIDEVNARLDEINRVFADLTLAEAKATGQDGFQPEIFNNMDLMQNRVTNLARSKDPGDAVSRVELEELGLFTNDGQVSFTNPVNFSEGATVSGGAPGSSSLTSVTQVVAATEAATEGLVATNVSGDSVSVRDDGVNGVTEGTLAMARNGHGRADFLTLQNGQLITTSPDIMTMLSLIYEELRKLNGVPNTGQSVPETS